jgi:hypothetical protein
MRLRALFGSLKTPEKETQPGLLRGAAGLALAARVFESPRTLKVEPRPQTYFYSLYESDLAQAWLSPRAKASRAYLRFWIKEVSRDLPNLGRFDLLDGLYGLCSTAALVKVIARTSEGRALIESVVSRVLVHERISGSGSLFETFDTAVKRRHHYVLLGLAHGTCGVSRYLMSARPHVRAATRMKIDLALKRQIVAIDHLVHEIDWSRSTYPALRKGVCPGWCHGQPSYLWFLLHASHLLGDDAVYERSLEKALRVYDPDRLPLKHYDLSLCHGHAGFGTITQNLFELSKDRRFLSLRKKWERATRACLEKRMRLNQEPQDSLFYGVCSALVFLEAARAGRWQWSDFFLGRFR